MIIALALLVILVVAKLLLDSDRKFVNDQFAVLMTLDTTNVNEFLKYFKNNLDKLNLLNNKETKVAFLMFHGSKRGLAGGLHLQ